MTDEHVDTVLRWVKACGGVDVVHAHESTLLDLARSAPPRELGEALEVLADLANPDRDADKVAALANRSFTCTKVGELVHVDAMVEPSLGEALKTAVEAGSRRPTGPHAADDGRSAMQRRADAFGEIVLRGIDPQPEHRTGRLRAHIGVTMTLDALRGIKNAPRPLLEHFGALPMPTVHRLMCDGDIARIILGTATGKPLDVGRNSRLATKRQRRALRAVFEGCAFPGCTVPFRFCDIHHLDWWCRGGEPTSTCWCRTAGATTTSSTSTASRRRRRPLTAAYGSCTGGLTAPCWPIPADLSGPPSDSCGWTTQATTMTEPASPGTHRTPPEHRDRRPRP